MPQFSGHWYSGRAARLVFIEAGLVALAMWISVHQAHGWREVAALIAAAACVPAALYLADLYDPQVMRNDRGRGASALKALGFAALAAACRAARSSIPSASPASACSWRGRRWWRGSTSAVTTACW